MSPTRTGEPRDPHEDGRPRMRAVVGSDRIEEEIFGRAFDGRVVRRIWEFVRPYRRKVVISIAAVIVFTLSQLTIPLLIRYAIDHGMAPDGVDNGVLTGVVAVFGLVIVINYVASRMQEGVTGRMAENVLFDIRRRMFGHLQSVSLSFMDKTCLLYTSPSPRDRG